MSEGDKLLPCPFCGSAYINLFSIDDTMALARCKDCGTEGPIADDKEEAVNIWNTRVFKVGAWECRKIEIEGVDNDIKTAS